MLYALVPSPASSGCLAVVCHVILTPLLLMIYCRLIIYSYLIVK